MGTALLALLISTQSVLAAPMKCEMPWLFFDLGNTIVDTADWNNLHYIQGAREYLETVHKSGYRIAILANVPEAWGRDDRAKLKKLKEVMKAAWKDSHEIPWEYFSGIYFNPRDLERKPKPYLFEKARLLAWPCPAIYQSEAADEVASAKNSGLRGYVIGLPGQPTFLPVASIPSTVEQVHAP